jgi:hypothetical protein
MLVAVVTVGDSSNSSNKAACRSAACNNKVALHAAVAAVWRR